MESVERFNRALAYIEETLDGKIDNAVFSRIAACPTADRVAGLTENGFTFSERDWETSQQAQFRRVVNPACENGNCKETNIYELVYTA